MRVPQRNFVVEFKSRAKRPIVSKDRSIWGDIDLKAVAREVESQAGAPSDELKQATVVGEPAVVDSPAVVTDAPIALTHAEEIHIVPEDDGADTGPEGSADEPQGAAEILAAPAANRPASSGARKKRRASMPRQRPKHSAIEQSAPIEPRPQAEAFGDLGALEDENRRLKALLRETLLTENMRLREMLARFS